MLKFVGTVLSSLKDNAVHRSNRAVETATLNLDSLTTPKISFHGTNLEKCHPAVQDVRVSLIAPWLVCVRVGAWVRTTDSLTLRRTLWDNKISKGTRGFDRGVP